MPYPTFCPHPLFWRLTTTAITIKQTTKLCATFHQHYFVIREIKSWYENSTYFRYETVIRRDLGTRFPVSRRYVSRDHPTLKSVLRRLNLWSLKHIRGEKYSNWHLWQAFPPSIALSPPTTDWFSRSHKAAIHLNMQWRYVKKSKQADLRPRSG